MGWGSEVRARAPPRSRLKGYRAGEAPPTTPLGAPKRRPTNSAPQTPEFGPQTPEFGHSSAVPWAPPPAPRARSPEPPSAAPGPAPGPRPRTPKPGPQGPGPRAPPPSPSGTCSCPVASCPRPSERADADAGPPRRPYLKAALGRARETWIPDLTADRRNRSRSAPRPPVAVAIAPGRAGRRQHACAGGPREPRPQASPARRSPGTGGPSARWVPAGA